MVAVLLVIAGVVVAVIAVLLFCPWRYRLQGAYCEGWAYHVSLRFACLAFTRERTLNGVEQAFSLLGHRFPKRTPRSKIKTAEDKAKPKAAEKQRQSGSRFSLHGFSVSELRLILRLAGDLLAALKPRVWHVDLLIGFIEPEYNGMLLGVYHTWKGLDPRIPCRVAVDWEREVVEFSGAAAGRVFLAGLGVRVLKHLLSRPGWRMVLRLVRERRKRSEQFA